MGGDLARRFAEKQSRATAQVAELAAT